MSRHRFILLCITVAVLEPVAFIVLLTALLASSPTANYHTDIHGEMTTQQGK